MKIACLLPTFGRPTLVANCLAMFEAQHYPKNKCRLFVLDDGAQIGGEGENWKIWSTETRFPTMTQKYNMMLKLLNENWPEWEAVALMDDDDIYGPQWLAAHATAFQYYPASPWSYPQNVFSIYGVNVEADERPIMEPAGSRFWASTAIKRAMLERFGGFVENPRIDFDQYHLNLWKDVSPPARPDDPDVAIPQYIYGWGRSNHCSTLANRPGWVHEHRRMETEIRFSMTPRMDWMTRHLYERVWGEVCVPSSVSATST